MAITAPTPRIMDLPLLDATPESIAPYGVMIGESVHRPGLSIPFYQGSVEEGANLDFVYHDQAVVRTARISHRDPEVLWLERHIRLSQIFVGLGQAPFALVLGQPNHTTNGRYPDLDTLKVFRLPPGHGVMIHQGTWHDFPMAFTQPVTILTMNSAEVVQALAQARPGEDLNQGDVYKLNVREHLGCILRVPF